ncbi:hypothetical protein [Colwellia sp. MEBiC06753]
MTALANKQPTASEPNVMSISTNARIDYILKFSRHTVVVIDEQQAGFGSISGTFLASLPDTTNAALIAVSSKLNDVQVRARINEQLFPNQPFDPELSLTQSVIEFYGQDKSPIAIVIEQAHHLSLQIIHELTLLSELAKKSGRQISVVLLGDIPIGKLIVDNYALFSKKLSLISAQNGQLISRNSPLFKATTTWFSFTPFNKMVMTLIALLLLTFVSLYAMYQRDSFGFSRLTINDTTQIEKPVTANGNNEPLTANALAPIKQKTAAAESSDIVQALLTPEYHPQAAEKAGSSEVFAAILATEQGGHEIATETEILVAQSSRFENIEQQPIEALPSEEKEVVSVVNNSSIQHSFNIDAEGVVIQYSALAIADGGQANEIAQQFARRYLFDSYQYYSRTINAKPFVVITSPAYANRAAAVEAMGALSNELRNSGIWIKAVDTVKRELNQAQ